MCLPIVKPYKNDGSKYVSGFQIYKNGKLDTTVSYNGLYDYTFVSGNTYELHATLGTGKYNVIMMARTSSSSKYATEGVVTNNGKASYVATITYTSSNQVKWKKKDYSCTGSSGRTFKNWYWNTSEMASDNYHWYGASVEVYAVWK